MAKRARGRKAAQEERPEELKLEIDLPTEGVGSEEWWLSEIEKSEDRLKEEIADWRGNLARYNGEKPKLYGISASEVVNVNVQFYTVEQKIPQLFFQSPQIKVKSRRKETMQAAPIVRAILNEYLGPDNINASLLMEEVLRDVLVPAGLGPTKIGYDRVQVPAKVPQLNPETGEPVLDEATGEPIMVESKKTIWDEYYWRRISPDQLRTPSTFLSTRFDEAPWMAWAFEPSEQQLKRYGIDATGVSSVDSDMMMLTARDLKAVQKEQRPCGYEIWYRAYMIDPAVQNPERVRQLVMVKGSRKGANSVLVHRETPYQQYDEAGKLQKGMRGFPIHVCTIRSAPSTAYPKSDCSVLRDLADEKSLGRSQMLQQRRRNLPLRGFDSTRVKPEVVKRIERGQVQGLIPFTGPISDDMFRDLAKAAFPHENMIFDRINQQDIDRIAASGANQQGVGDDDADTATEATIIQRSLETRMARERQRVIEFFITGVAKLFALFQLFADREQVVEMEGPEGEKQLATWNRDSIQGRFGFEALPDSAMRLDANVERSFWLKLYNLAANDPLVQEKRSYLLAKVLELSGEDPTKIIGKPPQKGPEEPRVSISVRGEDLQNPAVMELLQRYGIQLSSPALPPGVGPAGAEHPGAVNQVNPLDKHEADRGTRGPGRPPMVAPVPA